MEQTMWTYRDPAPSITFDTNGIKSFITDYLNGPAKRPLMIWCHNNPSIDRLKEYLDDYRREDGARLYRLGYPGREPLQLVLVEGNVKELDSSISEYPGDALLPYTANGKFFGFFYYDSSYITQNQFGEGLSRSLGLSDYYKMPAVFLVNDYAAFKVKDQIQRQLFDHVRYLPTVEEFIESAKETLDTENINELGKYVYSSVIDIAGGFVGNDDYAFYFDKLIDAACEIITEGAEGGLGLSATYREGPEAVTSTMGVGRMGFGGKLDEDDPESCFLKQFHAALQASQLAWMFDSSKPIPAEIAGFVHP